MVKGQGEDTAYGYAMQASGERSMDNAATECMQCAVAITVAMVHGNAQGNQGTRSCWSCALFHATYRVVPSTVCHAVWVRTYYFVVCAVDYRTVYTGTYRLIDMKPDSRILKS